ncbi:hypothetical protein K523DRAFT_51420 [Schizophyllum commune Tattone D]|nr:hypothetical protein K523DRAFT_51420 [Schizophyllum commune Tattone D]
MPSIMSSPTSSSNRGASPARPALARTFPMAASLGSGTGPFASPPRALSPPIQACFHERRRVTVASAGPFGRPKHLGAPRRIVACPDDSAPQRRI